MDCIKVLGVRGCIVSVSACGEAVEWVGMCGECEHKDVRMV